MDQKRESQSPQATTKKNRTKERQAGAKEDKETPNASRRRRINIRKVRNNK
jgi:hypothetical protein